ncbi:hypothetical protein ACFE04_010782 [Oxalis oulophora]
MSDPYEKAKGGRLAFKDGTLATRKTLNKNKKHKKKSKQITDDDLTQTELTITTTTTTAVDVDGGGGDNSIYTIDAAKKKQYEEIFPVEAKKFRYDDDFKAKSVEDALDARVKKKADRYCK